MCNRYRNQTSTAEMAEALDAVVAKDFAWKADIYPRYEAPVVISHEGMRRIGPMKWGFPMEVEGKTKMLTKHVTNARHLDSPFWKPSLEHASRRCLVPFTSFAEPKPGKDAEGHPAQYWFRVTDQKIACFAGLWRHSEEGPVFAFATTEPNPLIAPLHPKAMPVILLPEDQEKWLTGSYEDILKLQAPYPSQMMSVE